MAGRAELEKINRRIQARRAGRAIFRGNSTCYGSEAGGAYSCGHRDSGVGDGVEECQERRLKCGRAPGHKRLSVGRDLHSPGLKK